MFYWKLVWRMLPLLAMLWGLRAGAVESSATFNKISGIVKSLLSEIDMQSIARLLESECKSAHTIYQVPNLSDWIYDRLASKSKDPDLDHFGEPYELVFLRGEAFIVSSGPDQALNTDDDIQVKVSCLRQF